MRVAVLGAGYAGLTVARRLESALPDDVALVVVDDTGDHLVRHELHRVIRRPDFADEITVPLEDVLEEATIRRGRVTNVDPEAGRAELAGEAAIEYDVAAVCLGTRTAYFGLPDVEEHGLALEGVGDALAIREAALDADRVVVVGAGLTGVQVAGELAALASEDGLALEVTLVEALEEVAPGFARNFQRAVRDELEDLGVDVRTATAVTGASADAVDHVGGSISCGALVWTGGIRGRSALGGVRRPVRADLRLGDGTFVVGDAAEVVDRDGELVPASAQSAIAEARVAAANIARLVDRDGSDPFEPRLDAVDFEPRAWIVSVGDGAVAQVGPTVVRGRAALALKATAGVRYLSSVGAVREAVDLAREEFSAGSDDRESE